MDWPRPFTQITTIGRLTDMHENWHIYLLHPDKQKSLLNPLATPNRKSAILNLMVIFGVFHVSYFNKHLLQKLSNHSKTGVYHLEQCVIKIY